MADLFWTNNPYILFDKEHAQQIIPTSDMSYSRKLNALTRLTIILTALGFLFLQNSNVVVAGAMTIVGIILLQLIYQKTGRKMFDMGQSSSSEEEGFRTIDGAEKKKKREDTELGPSEVKKMLKREFSETTAKNPMANVLLTDISDSPNKKPAPPAFHKDVYEDINESTKDMVQNMNKDMPDLKQKIFGSLGENYNLDVSLRQFNSMPNTRVVNDQGAFAQFLYGNMPSCKEGNEIQCMKNNERYTMI